MFQISARGFSDVIPGLPVGLFVATLDLEHANLISSANRYLPLKTKPNPHQPEYIQPSPKDHLLGTMHDLKCRLCLSAIS